MFLNFFNKKLIRRVVSTLFVILAIVALVGGLYKAIWPQRIEVSGDTAIVRVPGEFSGNAVVSYNSQYLSQERENDKLIITFSKNGYYDVTIDSKRIVFDVKEVEKDKHFSLDLIQKERSIIYAKATTFIVIFTICGLAVICIVAIGIRAYRLKKRKERRRMKAQKAE